MIRSFLISFAFIFLTAVITGCSKDMTGTRYSIGFVSEYYDPERIEYWQDENKLYVYIYGQGSKDYSYGSDRYMILAEERGDTKYKKQLLPGSHSALTSDPKGLTVVCDTDIDNDYLAGSPLDDVILVLGYTYSEYVESGYKRYTEELKDTYGYDISTARYSTGHSPFFRFLKDLTPGDMYFMSNSFSLYFPEEFWPTGQYDLTITITGEGYELSETLTYIAE